MLVVGKHLKERQQVLSFNFAYTPLIIAASLDYLIGDPWGWPHPVRAMGWTINRCTQFALKNYHSSSALRRGGVILCVGLLSGSGLVGWLIVRGASSLHPFLGTAAESILLAACFAGRSLRTAAQEVLQLLIAHKLPEARLSLSQYVGRDTENLSEPEILRAVLETVAENATDGVLAPLFYAIVGAFLPFVGSVPLALVYKAASTLDSMVGYKEAPYTDWGWFSARLEDSLTWLPCRLTVMTLALLSRKPRQIWQICRRDAIKDPSPNSGWSECAYAAVLDVQLGGTNWYRGMVKHKPLLGNPIHSIMPEHIHQALQLTRYCFLIWLGVALFALVTLLI
ncbi:MAG: cobalamin biosynthesis protein [Chroococcidiopsidaceae cyanobacterium CP_BM_ER_R8_30]|nr:cobalamin biosynthesis protein [Chroococcidiopsidaceae cyanobacterium CP_BM_ER_R8_30]